MIILMKTLILFVYYINFIHNLLFTTNKTQLVFYNGPMEIMFFDIQIIIDYIVECNIFFD